MKAQGSFQENKGYSFLNYNSQNFSISIAFQSDNPRRFLSWVPEGITQHECEDSKRINPSLSERGVLLKLHTVFMIDAGNSAAAWGDTVFAVSMAGSGRQTMMVIEFLFNLASIQLIFQ